MRPLLKKWIFQCTLGELLGIGSAAVIAYFCFKYIGEPDSIGDKFIVLSVMTIAGVIEGALLGFFQSNVLVRKFSKLSKKKWIRNTIYIGALGWLLGMLPSLFLIPTDVGSIEEWSTPSPTLMLSMSLGIGGVLGALFGVFQWYVLRDYATGAYMWILANAVGWAVGISWIFLFASFPTVDSSPFYIITMGVLGGILAGITIGVITGWFLMRMKVKEAY